MLIKMRKTIIVTGASRGIGKAIATEFAAREYNLALLSRHYEEVKVVAEELKEDDRKGICLPLECDVQEACQVTETFQRIIHELGSIDVLVNNAGINSRSTIQPYLLDLSNSDWKSTFEAGINGWKNELETNLTGTYFCSYVAAGYMIKKGKGAIVNLSSIKGIEPTTSPGYGASKAGIIKLTKDMAKVLAPFGIRINCIAPGFIDTGMTAELSEEKKKAYHQMIPLGRFGTVEEVAKVAAFLASDDASYITGTTINVSGGYLM